MAKTKRGKRNKNRKNRRESPDKPRTCVSPDNIDTSQTIFNLVELITPILTPSPIFHEFDLFQPEKSINLTYKSTGKFSPIIQTVGNPGGENDDEISGKSSILNYRTPIKRSVRRSRLLTPRRTLPLNLGENDNIPKTGDENKTQINTNIRHDIPVDKTHLSSMIFNEKTPFINISPIHNSTPKIVANLVKNTSEVREQDDAGVHNLSPILKSSIPVEYGATKCSIQIEREGAQNLNFQPFLRHFQQKHFKFRRFPPRRMPLALWHVYAWIQNAFKKGYNSLKRLISGQNNQNILCKTCLNENKILNLKISELEAQLMDVKNELRQIETFKNEFNLLREQFLSSKIGINRAPPPPPPHPPPPPPPPPCLLIGPTPTSRPTKIMNRKEKQPDNSRPIITVEEILKVRLKKANVTSMSTRKNPKSPAIKTEEILRQIKLRPTKKVPPLPNPPVLGNSPVSSLERMLRGDSCARTTSRRAVKKTHFLSVNDVTRSPSFRFRQCNDSAPVM